MSTPLRVAINCELAPGVQAGGTQSVTSGLVRALGALEGPEEYLLISHPENRGWIEEVAGPNCRIVEHHTPAPTLRERGRRWLLDRLSGGELSPGVRQSDGFYEGLGAQVIHWPWQHFVITALPSIFNPHDLLHLHYPHFFQAREIAGREMTYTAACRIASKVVVASQWTRDDFAARYGLSPARLQIIPWAPPTFAGELPAAAVAAARVKYHLPSSFAFYPAVTWEHKNHLRLLQGLAQVRERHGLRVSLICTGHRFERFAPKVEAEIARLGLGEQVRFLGSVPFQELRAIYRASQFVIVPTLFEAASGPVFEAWQEGVPVACSTVTSLPQQAGDAALLFDPYSVEAIAEALRTMAADPVRLEELRTAGQRRLGDFSWERTARAYRALYRQAAGQPLATEESELLAWDWMATSRPTS